MSRWRDRIRISGGFWLLAAWFTLVNGWQLLAVILSAAALHELGHLLVLRLLGNTLLGFAALWAVGATAGITGITLGLNLWNALIIGVLGVPGLALLLLVQWVL